MPRTNDGAFTGYGVTLGMRGKDGSGRYVRVYDKGLESEEAAIGTWERWETEFSKTVAEKVGAELVASDNWRETCLSLALGAVEFREATGARLLKRRPLATWWAELLDNVNPVTIKATRIKTNLTRYGGWIRKAVVPNLATMAHESGQTLAEVVAFFTGGQHLAKRPAEASPVVWEYLDALVEVAGRKPGTDTVFNDGKRP